MNEAALLNEIRADLRMAPGEMVIYLEGKTDPEFLFALLGIPSPSDRVHSEVLIKGLPGGGGSGSTAVKARVDIASRSRVPRVIGVVDGDGQPLDTLAPLFDPPHDGPLFSWKAYCIENLLAKTGWPKVWGDEPDWRVELSSYGPYVALNRIGSEVRSILKDLGLEKYTNPALGESPRPATDIVTALAAGKARLRSFDVNLRFADELSAFEATVRRSLDEAHALLNGKWLLRHMAPTITKRNPDQCQFDWIAHARSAGGLSEVREWWERVTGSPP